MSATDNRLLSIFSAAVDHEAGAERSAYLDEVYRREPELRSRLEALLHAYSGAGQFLEPHPEVRQRPGEIDCPTTVLLPPAADAGTVIADRYKLLETIGEGGMGTVWLAEQSTPVRRTVALKLIKPGMVSKEVIGRFEAERQALALMDHPNIAKVYDGGVNDDGRPFFVMEFVQGIPITEFCDRGRLDLRERLELFVQICQAVQHAHQKGIIHRDLKPSNVLVAEQDPGTTRIVKVIDFGVAKAIGPQLTDDPVKTRVMQLVGTPMYMSPEQAELRGLDIDTRADIYSLGVLLYELLTGTTPFHKQRFMEVGYDEVRRIIREEEPPKPSSRLSTLDAAATTVSTNRGIDPRRLSRACRGELDWMVMKALEKDRNRRYETASAFAADVRRYLNDEPVLACPPSARYRLNKYLRRNRRAVLVGGVMSLTLFGGLIGTVYGSVASRNKRALEALWEQAVIARNDAETAQTAAEGARDGEAKAKREAEDAREKLAAVEYGRTIQVAHQEWRDNNVPATLALLASTRPDLRGWEWWYVYRLCHSHLLSLKGHTLSVWSASFSRDGSRLLTTGDNTVRVWNVETGVEVLTHKHTDVVVAAAFSPDGSHLVFASDDKTARVLDAKTGTEVLVLRGHNQAVTSASFSHDGTKIVTGSSDKTARVWSAKIGTADLTIEHTGAVLSASFSPDGTQLVTGCTDEKARVWNAKSGAEVLTLAGHTDRIGSASFDRDGTRIVTGSSDKTARVWDTKTGAEVLRLKHAGAVWRAAFSPDGRRLVTACSDRTARVYDAETGTAVLNLQGHTGPVLSASFSPNGTRLVTGSGDKTARVWDVKTGVPSFEGHTNIVRSASFDPDGARLVTASADGTARVWYARTGKSYLTLKHIWAVNSASFSPDGTRLVTGRSGGEKTAHVWNARSGDEVLILEGHTGAVNSASFSLDGTRLVTASSDKTVRVWNAQTGAELVTFHGHTQAVAWASFSPDGTKIVSGSMDRTAQVSDSETGALLLTVKHRGAVLSASFSPDGTRLITGSADQTAQVWDAKTGTPIFTLQGHTEAVRSASFSTDGTRVVTGSLDGTARVWDAKTGTAVLTLRAHIDSGVESASFSRDGSWLVTSGDTVRLWDGRPVPAVEGEASRQWRTGTFDESRAKGTRD